jgi:hypothetical protein
MGHDAQDTFVEGLGSATKGQEAREGRMKPLPRMTSVEPVIYGVLKIAWNDGYEGVVDLRPVIARGRIFEFIRNPENFKKVALEEYGHSIYWIDEEGDTIDLGADSLRRDAQAQAELHKLMAS